jgi:murein DD-endopeptidase MepM/ murein hydrolase activator NlpD
MPAQAQTVPPAGPPVSTAPPTITGDPHKGSILTCSTGEWTETPTTFAWRWVRDDVVIPDAIAQTYTVTGEDVGHSLICIVTATNELGSAEAPSAPLPIVTIEVRIESRTKATQLGPTLRIRGYVITPHAAQAGTVELVRKAGAKTILVAKGKLKADGEFVFEETIRALVPGRLAYVVRFIPADPELYTQLDAPVAVNAASPLVYPFARSAVERRPNLFDKLPPFWADGGGCSTGCRPAGARNGWPLKPFHEQHALRAGLNERRDSGFHVGIDIQAMDRQPVYAIQPGYAHIIQAHGGDARVQIGNYIYWHVKIYVREGEYVAPFGKIVGIVHRYTRHLHFSELIGGVYSNPLRPGGRVLAPWTDEEPPVIGPPRLYGDGSATVKAFDPQSFVTKTGYLTPVLAPAAVAYRVFDEQGRPRGPLEWAYRGTHWLPIGLIGSVYMPDAHRPGYLCFALQLVCRPNWDYRLAGGLAPRVPRSALPHGRYRLSVYAWDWYGNTSARDLWFTT